MLGVMAGSVYSFGWSVAGLGLTFGFGLWSASRLDRGSGRILVSVAVIFFGMTLGLARTSWSAASWRSEMLAASAVVTATQWTGVVVAEPMHGDQSLRLLVRPSSLRSLILVTVPRARDWHYGDRVEIVGGKKLELNDPARRRSYGVNFSEVRFLSSGHGWAWRAKLISVKHFFLQRLNANLPQPAAALAAGLAVGAKQSLGAEWSEKFRRTGLSHIVVLSGYNLTLIGNWLGRAFGFLPAAFGIVLFALLADASAATARAAIMALIVLTARLTGRLYQAGPALGLAATVMVLWNPWLLVSDLGFQLSVLATAGLIYLAPVLEKKLVGRWLWLPVRWGVRDIFITTVATQLAVFPLLLYQTNQISLAAVITNVLILPTIPLAMVLGFGASVNVITAALAYPILGYQLAVVKWFADLPLAALEVKSFPVWAAAVIYGFIILWFYHEHARQNLSRFTGR